MAMQKASKTLMAEQRKKSNDNITIAVVVLTFVGAIMMVLAMGMNERAFNPKPNRVTLTAAGCEYVQAQAGIVGKPVGKTGGCEVDVDYVSYKLGSGGYIYFGFEDTQYLEVSGGQVVGVIGLPEDPDRKWTYEQKKASWLTAASLIFMLAVMVGMAWSTRTRKSK